MEPKHLAPNARLERPLSHVDGDRNEVSHPGFESARESGIDRSREVHRERGAAQTEAQQVAMPALPTPVVPTVDDSTATPILSSDDTPATAGDDDLIEKEWVDKAKRILADTRDDPYRREQEVGRLQVEYIRKRYGREIGSVGTE